MTNKLYSMHAPPSEDYFARLSGFGAFPDAVVGSINFSEGKFYSIAETDIREKELYELEAAKASSAWFGQPV